jgi:ammonium transporter, Amt family
MLQYGCGHLDASGQVVATSQAQYAATSAHCVPFSVNGLIYTGSAHQLWEQARAAVWVILWSAIVTFILMQLIKLVLRGVRYKDEVLEVGDLAIHGEEAFPDEAFAARIGVGVGAGAGGGGSEPPTLKPPEDPVPQLGSGS